MENDTPLIDLGRTLGRGWKLLVLVVVLCALATGLVRQFVVTPKYEATAIFTVEPLTTNGELSMETEQVIATSNAVLDRAVTRLDGPDLSALKSSVSATVPRGSHALQITARATRPALAARAANAVADAYEANRVTSARRADDSAGDQLTDQIDRLRVTLANARKNTSEARSIQVQIDALQDQLTSLRSRAVYPGEVVSRAIPPTASSTPSMLLFVVAGATFGLIVGFFLVLLVDRIRWERESSSGPGARPRPGPGQRRRVGPRPATKSLSGRSSRTYGAARKSP